MRGNIGECGEIWGLGEMGGFTKYPPIPKPLVGGNTPEVNKALKVAEAIYLLGSLESVSLNAVSVDSTEEVLPDSKHQRIVPMPARAECLELFSADWIQDVTDWVTTNLLCLHDPSSMTISNQAAYCLFIYFKLFFVLIFSIWFIQF
jgi:hypothetical protein